MWLLALGALGLILGLTLQSAQSTTALSDWFRDWLLRFVLPDSSAAKWISVNIRRLGHVPEYFLLGVTVYSALRGTFPGRRVLLWAILICACVSLGDQGLKELIPVRHFDDRDLPMDVIGYSLGIAAASLAQHCIEKKRRKENGCKRSSTKTDRD